MSWDGVWEKGMVLAMWRDGPGHLIMDTGMQLLTHCGRRVTYLGAQVDTSWWFRVDQPGCFECRPSPMAEWAQQPSTGSVRPDDNGPDCRRCGKPTGKWWLSDAGADAEHRMLCASCDAADMDRALGLPVRPDEEPT